MMGMRGSDCRLIVAVVVVLSLSLSSSSVEGVPGGSWRLITPNAGVCSMHTAVTHLGTVVLLHHTNNGPSNVTFEGRCRETDYDRVLKKDCFGHSVVLDPDSGQLRPLMILTDPFCSSGSFLADGTLGQTGGDYEGVKRIRTLSPECFTVDPTPGSNLTQCDWYDLPNANLTKDRWYASNTLLPDGRQLVVGGRGTPFVELVPPRLATDKAQYLPFLNEATILPGSNNYYPYIHLLPDSNLVYLFAGRDSIIYNYQTYKVIKKFEKIPGAARNYPSGGSSVQLPLTYGHEHRRVEVLVCGGASNGSVNTENQFPCQVTCGRLHVTDTANSTWVMENMPMSRCMGDMVLTPDAKVIIINGAERGCQGWRNASVPTLSPVQYDPVKRPNFRFTVLNPTATPRVYHSTANLLPDASVLIAGSNTNAYYYFKNDNKPTHFPTELSVEAFTPPYTDGDRPTMMSVNGTDHKYYSVVAIQFYDLNRGTVDPPAVDTGDTFMYSMNSAPWSTHSYSMGQRMLTLRPLGFLAEVVRQEGDVWVNERTAAVRLPRASTVAPPAYYMLWVVKNGTPAKKCVWIRMVK